MLLGYRNAHHKLSADGMTYGRMFGGTGHLRWSDGQGKSVTVILLEAVRPPLVVTAGRAER